jgi:hypothetical protein
MKHNPWYEPRALLYATTEVGVPRTVRLAESIALAAVRNCQTTRGELCSRGDAGGWLW